MSNYIALKNLSPLEPSSWRSWAAPSLTQEDQAGWVFEQPGQVEGVPAHGRGLET